MASAEPTAKAGWEVKPLGEVCRIELGKTPARSNSNYWDKERQTDNVWLSIADLPERNLAVVSDSKEYISEEGSKLCKIVPKGTLMVSFKLTLGRLAYAGKDLYTNEAIAALYVQDDSIFAKHYLFYYLTFFDWDKAAEGDVKIKGKTLNKSKLKELNIIIPPLAEQERIVGILDEAFEGIAAATVQAEKNLHNARELFQSVLQSTFSQKGDDWVETTLGEVCELAQGLAINKKTKHLLVEKSSLPLLRIKDLREGTAEQFVAETGYPEKARIYEEDLIFTRTGQIGLVFTGHQGILHNNSFKITPNKTLQKSCLYWWLQNPVFKESIINLASRAAQPDITHKIFKLQKIVIPPLSTQQAIVEKLDALSEETKALEAIYERKKAALAELKQSLLQKAFAGAL